PGSSALSQCLPGILLAPVDLMPLLFQPSPRLLSSPVPVFRRSSSVLRRSGLLRLPRSSPIPRSNSLCSLLPRLISSPGCGPLLLLLRTLFPHLLPVLLLLRHSGPADWFGTLSRQSSSRSLLLHQRS